MSSSGDSLLSPNRSSSETHSRVTHSKVLKSHRSNMMSASLSPSSLHPAHDTDGKLIQRIMDYINSGKQQGAKVHLGGERHGTEGYWIQPTIFTDTTPDMRIVKEEIFGPVGVVIKFEDEEDVLRQANDTMYGLAAAVFTKDITRGIQFAHRLHAGTAWINCINSLHPNVPFGGYKQSGIGRECGEYALNKCVLAFPYLVEPRSRLIPCVTFLLAIPTSKPSTSTSDSESERRIEKGLLYVENM